MPVSEVKHREIKMTAISNFRNLVAECTNVATSDLSFEIRAMLAYADENATDSDIENFMDWLDGGTIWSVSGIIETTNPKDNFECLEGMTWEDLRTWYEEYNY